MEHHDHLSGLAKEIAREIELAAPGLEHARRAGELLTEAKKLVPTDSGRPG